MIPIISKKHFPALALTAFAVLASACSPAEEESGGVYGQLTTDSLDSARVALGRTERSTLLSSPTCDSSSYKCSVSPSNYLMAYTKIELIKLTDTSAIEGTNSISTDDIATATSITDSAIETDPDEFDIPADAAAELGHVSLANVDADYDGIAVTYAYLQQELDTGTLGDDAVENWANYQICLQSNLCSNSEATIGDYLLQGDTTGWGFIEYSGCLFPEGDAASCEEYALQAEKPEDFSATDPVFAQGNVLGENWYIVKDTGDTLTSYRVFYPFEKDDSGSITHTIDADSEITLTYSTADSFEWHDGAMMDATASGTQPVKVATRDGSTYGDDTLSEGTFNPTHDTAFLPRLPGVKVEVAEAAETTTE